jgi:uncharacterized protein YraI
MMQPTPVSLPTRTARATALAFTPLPTQTSVPSVTPTHPPDTPTPQPTVEIEGKLSGAELNVRSGPGTVFPIVARLKASDSLIITATSAGGEWLEVRLAEGQNGWVSASLVEIDGDVNSLPISDAFNNTLVQGRVEDADGLALDGIPIIAYQSYTVEERLYETETNEDGQFYFYLPKDATGLWTVEIGDVPCSSPIMDSRCRLNGQFTNFGRDWVKLPQTSPLRFVFTPKP